MKPSKILKNVWAVQLVMQGSMQDAMQWIAITSRLYDQKNCWRSLMQTSWAFRMHPENYNQIKMPYEKENDAGKIRIGRYAI